MSKTADSNAADHSPATHGQADPSAPEGIHMTHRQILVVLSGLMLGMLLAALDQTIVATALPRITADLGGQQHLAWVVTAYLLTSTASTPLYGKISDLYGRKSVFQFAIVVFLVGSALAGASQNMLMLIATRAVQGLGAGGLITLALAIIGDVISPRERGRYQGYFGAVFGLSSVIGPLLGGFFTEDLSWRWVFYINLPLGGKAHNGGYAWVSGQIVGLFVVGGLLLATFILWEARAAEPILPLRLFHNKVFTIANIVGFILGFTMFGAIIYLPVYLQVVKGVSPTVSGLQLLPLMVGVLGTSIGSGRIITKIGRYKMFPIIGMVLVIIGFGLMSRLKADTAFWPLAGEMVILGAGMGCIMQVLVLAIQNSVDYADLGVGTSSNTFFRSMGSSIGVAVFGALVTNSLTDYVRTHAPVAAQSKIASALANGQSGSQHQLPAELKHIFNGAYVHAIDNTFLWTLPLAGIGLLLTLILPEKRLSTRSGLGRTATAPAGPTGSDAEQFTSVFE